MHVTIDQGALANALQLTKRVIPSKSTMPVLSTMHLRAEADAVEITATDLSTSIRTRVRAEVEETGTACLQAEQLAGFVAGLPSGRIEIVTGAERHANLKAHRARSRVAGLDPEDFPAAFGATEGTVLVSLTAGNLRSLLERTLHAVATLSDRPSLEGLRLEGRNESLLAAGANGFILASAAVPVSDLSEPFVAVPSGEGLRDLLGILGRVDPEAGVVVSRAGAMLVFATETVTLGCRLVEGDYPDFQRVIPQGWTTKATLSPFLIRSALALVTPFESEKIRMVHCHVEEDGFRLTARGADAGGDGEATVEGAVVEGDPLTIRLNSRYLSSIVNAFTDDEIEMCLTAPLSPALIRGQSCEQIAVIMPMYEKE